MRLSARGSAIAKERNDAQHKAMRLWYVAATPTKKYLYGFVHDDSDWG